MSWAGRGRRAALAALLSSLFWSLVGAAVLSPHHQDPHLQIKGSWWGGPGKLLAADNSPAGGRGSLEGAACIFRA